MKIKYEKILPIMTLIVSFLGYIRLSFISHINILMIFINPLILTIIGMVTLISTIVIKIKKKYHLKKCISLGAVIGFSTCGFLGVGRVAMFATIFVLLGIPLIYTNKDIVNKFIKTKYSKVLIKIKTILKIIGIDRNN